MLTVYYVELNSNAVVFLTVSGIDIKLKNDEYHKALICAS